MKNRITQARTRKGDSGFSNLVNGSIMPKSSEICSLQNQVQFFNNSLRTFVRDCPHLIGKLPVEHQQFLSYLSNSFCNSFSASIWYKFQDANFSIPKERLQELESLNLYFLNNVENLDEFIIINDDLLGLELAMLHVRETEHKLWVVLKVYRDVYGWDENSQIYLGFSAFLNALSDFLFNMARFFSQKVTYWTTEI